jgi:hypothetical protein
VYCAAQRLELRRVAAKVDAIRQHDDEQLLPRRNDDRGAREAGVTEGMNSSPT